MKDWGEQESELTVLTTLLRFFVGGAEIVGAVGFCFSTVAVGAMSLDSVMLIIFTCTGPVSADASAGRVDSSSNSNVSSLSASVMVIRNCESSMAQRTQGTALWERMPA